MHVDYIIVGLGLAGLAFAEELRKHNKSFVVFEDASQHSSMVAAGTYNPVVLKRFTPVWDIQSQLALARPFYKQLEKQFKTSYDHSSPIYRIFKSIEEQNNWFAACDKPVLCDYLNPKVISNSNSNITAPFGFGEVEGTGWIDTKNLLLDYRKYLSDKELLKKISFHYDQIEFKNSKAIYGAILTDKIVFCEGYGLRKNPYFKNLPMEEAKGEILTIHAPKLDLNETLKGPVFIKPLGNHLYKVGATFNWDDKTSVPTFQAKEELLQKLKTMINSTFEVVDHKAGIRPTTNDRRPLIGQHHTFKQLAILNGLGTRGVLLAPKMAKSLYNYLELGQELPSEISIDRYYDTTVRNKS